MAATYSINTQANDLGARLGLHPLEESAPQVFGPMQCAGCPPTTSASLSLNAEDTSLRTIFKLVQG